MAATAERGHAEHDHEMPVRHSRAISIGTVLTAIGVSDPGS